MRGEQDAVQLSRVGMWKRVARSMAFRIETASRGKFSVFILSGHIETPAIGELKRLFGLHTNCSDLVVDLKDVSLVDREVMRFLKCCEADGVTLENCTPYLREWMEREND